jgi:hypothetical protein
MNNPLGFDSDQIRADSCVKRGELIWVRMHEARPEPVKEQAFASG